MPSQSRLNSVPVLEFFASNPRPALIKRLHNLLRQGTLVESGQVVLKMMRTTGTNDDGIAQVLFQLRMMSKPS